MIEIRLKKQNNSFSIYRNKELILTLIDSDDDLIAGKSDYNDQELEIRAISRTGNRFRILKRGTLWGEIYPNDQGNYIIRLIRADGAADNIFVLRTRGINHDIFDLFHEAHYPVLTLHAEKSQHNQPVRYLVGELRHDFCTIAIDELLLYSAFCANSYFTKSETPNAR